MTHMRLHMSIWACSVAVSSALAVLCGCEAMDVMPAPADEAPAARVVNENQVCLDFTAGGFSYDDINLIKARMEEDFAEHGYTFVVWSNGCGKRLVFGGSSREHPTYYGLADIENNTGYVFTGRMLVDWLPTRPHEVFVHGVANAAAHELGHLIARDGTHSSDWNNVMSVPPIDELYFVNQVYTPVLKDPIPEAQPQADGPPPR